MVMVMGGFVLHGDSRSAFFGGLLDKLHNLVSNLDVFLLAQYKRLVRSTGDAVDDIHGYAGAMFRF